MIVAEAGWCRAEREGGLCVLAAGGRWTLGAAEPLEAELQRLDTGGAEAVRVDLSSLAALDTAGAWLLHRFIERLRGRGVAVEMAGAAPAHAALIARMAIEEERKSLARPRVSPLREMTERVGRVTVETAAEARDLLSFFGLICITLVLSVARPGRLRFVSLVSHLERVGLNAMPIVGLLSFLIGVVLAFQGADQLRQFGAEIYTINLLGVSVLREIGILLTAILVAGRSGSAFTAEIGTMKINEEIDALKTLGLDPMEILVLPRLIAVMIALPLLAFFANMAALLGGALMTVLVLSIETAAFLSQLQDAITASTFWIGLVKAPFFAFLIGMVGCYEGLKVEGSAESVGRLTTKSVVESIFLVIVADAMFSILFSYLGI
ncbi:MAG: ABC transporter permease [Pseudomonadota bacterium]